MSSLLHSDRGREGRLARLVADTMNMQIGAPYGIGVDESTSLVITNVDTASASGEVSSIGMILGLLIASSQPKK